MEPVGFHNFLDIVGKDKRVLSQKMQPNRIGQCKDAKKVGHFGHSTSRGQGEEAEGKFALPSMPHGAFSALLYRMFQLVAEHRLLTSN